MNPIDELKRFDLKLEEYNLKQDIGVDFWHSSIQTKEGCPLSGGYSTDIDASRKIAYAEYLERKFFTEIKKSHSDRSMKWGLNLINTACGFAGGFDLRNTIIRSVGEGLERWVLSKWVDENYILNEMTTNDIIGRDNQSTIMKWYESQFDNVQYLYKDFIVKYDNSFLNYRIYVSIAMLNDGVYLGSAYGLKNEPRLLHSLVESYRHLLISKNIISQTNSFPDNRVRFFSKNKNIAIDVIKNMRKNDWPIPIISFHYNEFFKEYSYFLSRTIFTGWESWNKGPVERFLY